MSQGARPTFQKRSQKTRDLLVLAIDRLLHQKSFEEITVAEIAASAGVSPASIYRRFKNKEALIPVLFDLYMERLQEWSRSPDAQIDIENIAGLRGALKVVSARVWLQLMDQAHIMRAVYIYSRIRPELLDDRWLDWEEQTKASIRAILAHFSEEVKRENTEKAVTMLMVFYNAIFIEYGLFETTYDHLQKQISADEFADEVAEMVYGYLTMRG